MSIRRLRVCAASFVLLLVLACAILGVCRQPAEAQNSAAAGSPTEAARSSPVTNPSIFSSEVDVSPGTAPAYAAAVMYDHPRAYYALNDKTLVLQDLGPHRIDGRYGSGVVKHVAPITSGVSAASEFRGSGSYDPTMFAAAPAAPDLQPAFLSLEAWIKVGSYNTTGRPLLIASYGRYVNGARYGLFLSQQNVLFYTQHNSGRAARNVFGSAQLLPGSTYHCVATSDGRSLRLYVNGQLQNTISYSGTPDYGGTGKEGLYIGGARGSELPAFNGMIAQVAVYARALAPSVVLRHFVAGQLAPMVTEAAPNSDYFVDSIGVNTHFTDYASLYGTHYRQARAALTGLGIRHIRDGLFAQRNRIQYAEYRDLGSAGIHGLFTTSLTQTQSVIESFPAYVGAMFEGYEAPNEQDETSNPNWVELCRSFQRNLYRWVKTDSATRSYPVVGPSLVSGSAYFKVGDVSASMDNANIHDYMNPRNPGTSGWGSLTRFGEYGSITYNLNLVTVTSANKPVVATETGYSTIPRHPLTLDYRADLRYIPRLLFEQFNHGIRRTYLYELLDKGGNLFWNNFGLVRTDFTPKPAYTAVKSIVRALTDPGSYWRPQPLTYQIVGDTNNVHHTLLHKRNGSYIVAVWIEAPSWDVSSRGVDIAVPNQQITVRTAGRFARATLLTLDEDGDLSQTRLRWTGHETTFAVSDKVALLTIEQ